MSGTGHKVRHKGPVLTLSWKAALEIESRVLVGTGAKQRLPEVLKQLETGKRVLVLRQGNVGSDWLPELFDSLSGQGYDVGSFALPDGENCKDVEWLPWIWELLQRRNFDRTDTVVAVGGGALSDLAGFAASTFMRGINLVLIPTTLLAQVDAAIGGKTAINLASGKNLAGSFYFPRAVLADPAVFSTLPERQFVSGLGEIIKYALIEQTVSDETEYNSGARPLFEVLEQNLGSSFTWDDPALSNIIISCIKMKLSVVGKDPREAGLRRVLNLGHTLGHALEKVSNYSITHGEAISIGMVFAFELAQKRNLIDMSIVDRMKKLLMQTGLPVAVDAHFDRRELIEAISHDKKKQGNNIRFVLPKTSIGIVDYDVDIDLSELSELIENLE